MTGWWKFWPAEILRRLARTRTPRQCTTGRLEAAALKTVRSQTYVRFAIAIFLLIAAVSSASAQSSKRRSKKSVPKTSAAVLRKSAGSLTALPTDPGEKELAQLSRGLRDSGNATTYGALAAFANRNAKNELGARAALALGYYDLSVDRQNLALGWLRKAVGDKLLREYVQYWQAQTSLALGQREEGLEQFKSFLRDFPESVMTEPALTSYAQTALAAGKSEEALAALNGNLNVTLKPALLLLRAQAEEKVSAAKGEKPTAAAADYLDLYYRFPLNAEATKAGQRIPSMQFALGESFPGTPMQAQIVRAETFYIAKRWSEARAEYTALLPKLAGSDRERAQLRVAQCNMQSGGKIELLNAVSLTDPELDAERLYAISQAHRSQKLESQMIHDVEELTQRFPKSSWVEDGLFAAGNFYWVNLDRARATDLYRRALDAFPYGKYAQVAAWRVAWTAYLEKKSEAADLLEAYVRAYPTSSYVQDALYWLGRSYERAGNPAHARSFYLADASRFPLTYFGARSVDRLRPAPDGIGSSPANPAQFLSVVPPAPSLPSMDQPLSAKAQEREARGRALGDIAFDSSAELEYRAAYSATHSPKFLIDAAGAAIAAGHYAAGMVAIRQAFPQLEARRVPEIPVEAWRAAFPLPYESSVRGEAARNQLDPMLVAGLIRQESAFESNATSRVGAVGLMQVMPKTASKLARQLKVKYVRGRLTDPGYNLQLGSRYLAGLIQAYGTPEAALAAYNAGEERVAQWTAGQNYLEPAEFVESIPFTETREYVQIVMRNADVYRQVYGPKRDEVNRAANMEADRVLKSDETRPAGAQGLQ